MTTQASFKLPLALFKELAELPTYSSAAFLSPRLLSVQLSTASQLLKTRLTHTKVLALDGPSSGPVPAVELPKDAVEVFSPDGKLKAVFKKVEGKRIVEIWDWQLGTRRLEMDVSKSVGDLVADETWGLPVFSPHSDSLAFVAHRLPKEDLTSPFDEFEFTPSWGELNRDLVFPAPFLLRFAAGTEPSLTPVVSRTLDPTTSFGQPAFGFDGKREILVVRGYDTMEDGRRYGIVFCVNRRSSIWALPLPAAGADGLAALSSPARLISDPERSARSPRVFSRKDQGLPDTLVYLENLLGGAHASCASLLAVELDGASPRTLVDSVWEPSEDRDFPGLYLNTLPVSPFLSRPSPAVVLGSIRYSRETVYVVPLDCRSSIQELSPSGRSSLQKSWRVLATDGQSKVAAYSTAFNKTPALSIAEISEAGAWCWTDSVDRVLPSPEARAIVKSLSVDSTCPTYPVETLFVSSSSTSSSSSPPLILVPHGGPHGTSTNVFSPTYAALAHAGFTVALVNYTGSLGFGERWVRELVGKCGELDVKDCIGVVEQWVEQRKSSESQGKIFMQGGSHGGFLTAHLTSLYPDVFEAAILRNPVISLGENATVSDIPDWNFAELGLPFPFSAQSPRALATPSPEQYAFLHARSPIANVLSVQAHTLLLMGGSDARVPPPQTKAWYHSLRGKSDQIAKGNAQVERTGVGRRRKELEVACLVFEKEGHSLSGVEAEFACFEAGLEWFTRNRA